jgi:hypothetical protein
MDHARQLLRLLDVIHSSSFLSKSSPAWHAYVSHLNAMIKTVSNKTSKFILFSNYSLQGLVNVVRAGLQHVLDLALENGPLLVSIEVFAFFFIYVYTCAILYCIDFTVVQSRPCRSNWLEMALLLPHHWKPDQTANVYPKSSRYVSTFVFSCCGVICDFAVDCEQRP